VLVEYPKGETPLPLNTRREMGSRYFFLFTVSLKVWPTLKRTAFEAAILMASPVAGLRPLRAARLENEKLPKPVICTVSPFVTALVTIPISEITLIHFMSPFG